MSGHLDVVERIKADLEARKVSLVGPCGALQITKRVVWELRDEGAGLLEKLGGNNCEGYAVDIVCYPDGVIWDILANSGGDEDAFGNPIPGTGNRPTWSPPSDGKKVDPRRWCPPVNPGDVIVPPVIGPPSPDAPPVGTNPIGLVALELVQLANLLDDTATCVRRITDLLVKATATAP